MTAFLPVGFLPATRVQSWSSSSSSPSSVFHWGCSARLQVLACARVGCLCVFAWPETMGVVRFCSVTWSVKGSALDLLCLPGFDCVASEYVAAAVYAFVSAWAVSVSRVGECALVRVGVFEYADITHALTSLTRLVNFSSRACVFLPKVCQSLGEWLDLSWKLVDFLVQAEFPVFWSYYFFIKRWHKALNHREELFVWGLFEPIVHRPRSWRWTLTLPLEVDQTTTMYSWREPSTSAILFCCQAWIGADYEKRALFFFMSSRDRVAMATLVLDLRMHPFRCSYDDFFKCNAQGTCLGPLACSRKRGYCYIDSFLITWWLWKPVQLDGHLDWLHFDNPGSLNNCTCSCMKHWHDSFRSRGIKMESIKVAIQLHWFLWPPRYVKLVYWARFGGLRLLTLRSAPDTQPSGQWISSGCKSLEPLPNQSSPLPSIMTSVCTPTVECYRPFTVGHIAKSQNLNPKAHEFVPQSSSSYHTVITIGHLNINHLRYKMEEIREIIIHHKLHILGVTETWLDQTVSDGEVEIQGYRMFRLDRKGKAGGGVCIYIHQSLSVRPLQISKSELEMLWIALMHVVIVTSCELARESLMGVRPCQVKVQSASWHLLLSSLSFLCVQ